MNLTYAGIIIIVYMSQSVEGGLIAYSRGDPLELMSYSAPSPENKFYLKVKMVLCLGKNVLETRIISTSGILYTNQ